eukprot:824377-Rhodomonas_salina.1
MHFFRVKELAYGTTASPQCRLHSTILHLQVMSCQRNIIETCISRSNASASTRLWLGPALGKEQGWIRLKQGGSGRMGVQKALPGPSREDHVNTG